MLYAFDSGAASSAFVNCESSSARIINVLSADQYNLKAKEQKNSRCSNF
jgi:hypothetical protein